MSLKSSKIQQSIPQSKYQQKKLSTVNPTTNNLITPQQVWPVLNQHQREKLFHQMVKICCSLVKPKAVIKDQEEVSNE